MNIAALQAALNARGQTPPLVADGIPGKKTMAAIDALLSTDRGIDIRYQDWGDARRQVAAEQIVYRDLKIEVGEIDGLIGEQVRQARRVYVARQANAGKPDPKVETWRDADEGKPPLVPAPVKAAAWPTQSGVTSFFGSVGEHQVSLEFPIPMRLAWEPSTNVFRTSCHAKVLAPMQRIWKRVFDHYGHEGMRRLRLDMYGGCLNVRKMRGGSAWSMHSWGIAMDIDPDRNQLKWHRNLASLDDPPYEPYWKIVEDEGAISLGRARDYDWMHFQFARL